MNELLLVMPISVRVYRFLTIPIIIKAMALIDANIISSHESIDGILRCRHGTPSVIRRT